MDVQVEETDGLPEPGTGGNRRWLKQLSEAAKAKPGAWFRTRVPDGIKHNAAYYKGRGFESHVRTLDKVVYIYMQWPAEEE